MAFMIGKILPPTGLIPQHPINIVIERHFLPLTAIKHVEC